MGKKKPCKPKPKMTDEIWAAVRTKMVELYALEASNAEIDYLYELTLGNSKKAHVLCPIHIK